MKTNSTAKFTKTVNHLQKQGLTTFVSSKSIHSNGRKWVKIGTIETILNAKALRNLQIKTAIKVVLCLGMAKCFSSIEVDKKAIASGVRKTHIYVPSNKQAKLRKEILAFNKITKTGHPNARKTSFPIRGLQLYLTNNSHLDESQKKALAKAFKLSLKSSNQKQTLYDEIMNGVPSEWGQQKAEIIFKDLIRIRTVSNYARKNSHLNQKQKEAVCKAHATAVLSNKSKDVFIKSVQKQINILWAKEKASIVIKDVTNLKVFDDKSQVFLSSPKQPSRKTSPAKMIANIAKRDGMVAFYKTGVTQSFGNFAECKNGITIGGNTFKCAEAAFQYEKCRLAGVPSNQLKDFLKTDGEEAFRISRRLITHTETVSLKWLGWFSPKRQEIMWEILKQKYSQNPDILKLLQASGSAYLLEHNETPGRDDYWSDNHNGDGKNMLGLMLMAIRDGKGMPKNGNSSIIKQHAQTFEDNQPYPIW